MTLLSMAQSSLGKYQDVSFKLFVIFPGINQQMHTRYDGQVGTASITLIQPGEAAERSYLDKLYLQLRQRGLPDYTIPRLVRFTKQ
jgi:hypothetical protein